MTPEDLDKRAKELGVLSIETSAKAGHNVKTLFKKIAMALPGGAESRDAAVNQSESETSAVLNKANDNRDRRVFSNDWRGAASVRLCLLMGWAASVYVEWRSEGRRVDRAYVRYNMGPSCQVRGS